MAPQWSKHALWKTYTNIILREIMLFESTEKNLEVVLWWSRDAICKKLAPDEPLSYYSWEQEVLLYPESTHTLLSFNDIRANGLQLRPMLWKVRILLITKRENGKHVLESFSSIGHRAMLAPPVYTTFRSSELFCLWHNSLGHASLTMMSNIFNSSHMVIILMRKTSQIQVILCARMHYGEVNH